jgi:hypothetical protein
MVVSRRLVPAQEERHTVQGSVPEFLLHLVRPRQSSRCPPKVTGFAGLLV